MHLIIYISISVIQETSLSELLFLQFNTVFEMKISTQVADRAFY